MIAARAKQRIDHTPWVLILSTTSTPWIPEDTIVVSEIRPMLSPKHALVQIGTGTKGPGIAVEEIFKRTGLSYESMEKIVVTGYGRFTFEEADEQISEIKIGRAHV